MPIAPHTHFGRFEILSLLGAGGMGEVYRARDAELHREVAIKFLPDSLVLDPERVARFEREARVLASMSHPNIGVIHELGRVENSLFLVLELIPGNTLAERLRLEKLPLRDILLVFRQIASALESAHARGIVHRDLKPENVKFAANGDAKVLDFGLAKEIREEVKEVSTFDTQTGPMTRENVILGTPPYMSPEQARLQPVDKRTDVWAFGCCLYEALSGRRAFDGKTHTDVLAAVIHGEPDFGVLSTGVPRDIVRLVRRCLEKDLHRRLQDIGDARIQIEEALEGPLVPEVEPRPRATYIWTALFSAAALAVGLVLGSFAPREESRAPVVGRFSIEIPPAEPMALASGPSLAISPDGSRAVYVARRGDSTELRLRRARLLEPVRLGESSGALAPFFSPSGEDLGFFSRGKLHLLSLSEPGLRSLAEAPSPRGASWQGDRIVFSPRTDSGLAMITAGSGSSSVAALTVLDSSKGERSHRWPALLPDASVVLFTSWKDDGFDIEAQNLDSGARKLLVEKASYPRYSHTRHLIFVRDSALWAAKFDPRALQLTSDPVPLEEYVHYDPLTGAAFYDLSSSGTLVYAPRQEAHTGEVSGQILAIDRHGVGRILVPTARGYQVPRFSPSDRELLVTVTDEDSTDVWSIEPGRGAMSRVTFESDNAAAIWSPDGRRITFSSDREGTFNLFTKTVDSSDAGTRLTSSPNAQFPNSWSPDGSALLYTELDPESEFDLWIWDAATGRSAPFLRTPFNESAAVFSPDGRFVAYVSNETGEDEVYVHAFPGREGKWPVSTGGGREPVWSDDGSELFYREEEWMMAVAVEAEPTFAAGKPARLFEAPFDEAGAPYAGYEVTRDGREFVMVRTAEGLDATGLVVVVNWLSELESRAKP